MGKDETAASDILGLVLMFAGLVLRVLTIQHVFMYGLPHIGLAGVHLGLWQAWGAVMVLGVVRGSVGEDNNKDSTTILHDGVVFAMRDAFGLLLVWAIL